MTPYEIYKQETLWERIHTRIMWYALRWRYGRLGIAPRPWKRP